MKSLKDNFQLFFKGILMGAADVVPGVSGGTIAFITGIYVELVATIKGFNLDALRVLKTKGFAVTWTHINGNFIIVLLAGIVCSVLSLAQVMQYLLLEQPLPLWSFFSGLIIGSVLFLLRQTPAENVTEKILFIIGIAIAYSISIAPAIVVEGTTLTMFFAGSIALCAMILPGISGSFILVLLGLYPVFISAIADLNMTILCAFALGGVSGLMMFSRLLSWLLDHYQSAIITLMCGFLVGSLNIIWPWKQTIESQLSNTGKLIVTQTENLLPAQFAQINSQDPQLVLCLMMLLVGFFVALGLEYMGKPKSDTRS
ncbi:MAG: DUF368 domain-containing protein [Porticoccaceae bacterium]|nr:DUF368 domain-containing protein [Porticoccaceae bacterium]